MHTSNLSFPKARVSMEHYSSIFSNFIATRKIWSLPRMLNDSINMYLLKFGALVLFLFSHFASLQLV